MKERVLIGILLVTTWACTDDKSTSANDVASDVEVVLGDAFRRLPPPQKDTSTALEPVDVSGARPPTLPADLFKAICEQQKVCSFHSTVAECVHEATGVWYSLPHGQGPACGELMVEMITCCALDTPNPCVPSSTAKCNEIINTFQSGCLGFKVAGNASERWAQVCEAYKLKEPQDCDPSVTMDSVMQLCEFVGAIIKETDECFEKIDLYLECLPQTEYYCPPGQLVPRPNPDTGCYKEASPFAIPNGECIQN